MFSGSRKTSSDFAFSKSPTSPPPPYCQSLCPLLLAETTTTRTEVVTTTTTETTTQLFSIPYWRKRHISQPTSPKCRTFEGFSGPAKSRSSHLLQLDKELPPTPLNVVGSHIISDQFISPQISTVCSKPQSAPTHQPALMLHSSPSLHLDTSVTSPLPSSTPVPSAPLLSPPSQLRRAKSTQRLQTFGVTVDKDHLVQRRRRGVSFGASSLLGIGTSDAKSKGKGKEADPECNSSRSSPKPLSRKSSFWSKKKTQQLYESTRPTQTQDDVILTLPPLPIVDVSPFAAEFPLQHIESLTTNPSVAPLPTKRCSDKAESRSATLGSITTSSRHSLDAPVHILPKQDSLFVPRPRIQTPSTLFHRISLGVFSSPEPSPSSTSSLTRPFSQNLSLQLANSIPIAAKSDASIPKPAIDNESPEVFVSRLKTQVSKAEVASILASKLVNPLCEQLVS